MFKRETLVKLGWWGTIIVIAHVGVAALVGLLLGLVGPYLFR